MKKEKGLPSVFNFDLYLYIAPYVILYKEEGDHRKVKYKPGVLHKKSNKWKIKKKEDRSQNNRRVQKNL